MKLIDKDALMEEIKRLREVQPIDEFQPKEQNKIDWMSGKLFTINNLEFFIDTLEVKEVDFDNTIDLDKVIGEEWKRCNPIDEGMGVESAYIHIEAFYDIAKYFFELGLSRKGK